MTPELDDHSVAGLAKWLHAKYARHGEIEDKLAADALEVFARLMTLKDAVELRLCVPAAPSELAASLGAPIGSVRQALHRLRSEGVAEMMDKTVPVVSKRGRKHEHLWRRPQGSTITWNAEQGTGRCR
jgi:hypothetical protein